MKINLYLVTLLAVGSALAQDSTVYMRQRQLE